MAYTRKVGTSKPTGVSDKYKNLRNKVLDCIEHPGSPNIVGLKKLLQNKYPELAQEILVKPPGSGPTRFLLTNFLNLLDIVPTRDCPVCGNFIYCNRLRFPQHCSKNCSANDPLSKIKRSESYFEKTGYKNPLSNPEVQKSIRKKLIKEHGVTNVSQLAEVKAAKAKTCLKTHGVTNPSKSKAVQEKKIEAEMLKYGCRALAHESVKAKIAVTNLEKAGFTTNFLNPEYKKRRSENYFKKTGYYNPLHNPDVVKRWKRKHQDKYGCRSPMQRPEIFEKVVRNSVSYKEAVIQGKLFKGCQGAEIEAIKFLVASGKNVKDIFSGKNSVPTIDSGNSKHFPDLLVNHQGLEFLVEVKSTYTLGLCNSFYDKDPIEQFKKTIRNLKAVERSGYTPILMIKTGKGKFVSFKGCSVPSRSELRDFFSIE